MSRNRTSGVAILMVACGLIAEAGSPLQADVLHVRREAAGANDGRTWDDAFRELSAALTAARAGDEIWVAAGTYKPAPDGLDRTASFVLRSGVSVYGGFAGTEVRREARDPNPETNGTILDGDLNDDDAEGVVVRPDNSLHVLVGSGTDATAMLDGFTIRGGYADGPSDALEGAGAGLLNDHGSPTLRGCLFTDNIARRGGAVANFNGSDPTFDDCTFRANACTGACDIRGTFCGRSFGGGMYNDDSSPTLTACTFEANVANAVCPGVADPFSCDGGFGGGLYNTAGSQPQLVDCLFIGNAAAPFCLDTPPSNPPFCSQGVAGAMYNEDVQVTLAGCTFRENTGLGGALNSNRSVLVLTDCLFIENRFDGLDFFRFGGFGGGGAIVHRSGELRLTRCVFRENSGLRGGALESSLTDVTMTKCRFEGNHGIAGGAVVTSFAGTLTAENCAFIGNRTPSGLGGGMQLGGGDVTLSNCLFVGNVASNGGGLANSGADLMLINCTFGGNTATGDGRQGGPGGGVSTSSGSRSVLVNCILWGNRGPDGMTERSQIFVKFGRPDISYSCIQGLDRWAGNSNRGESPQFVREPDDGGDGWGVGDNDDFGDLRLQAGSPYIDAGDTTVVTTRTDVQGGPRRVDIAQVPDRGRGTSPFVDLGAIEFHEECNGNGTPDDEDIRGFTSADCNVNGVPDECEGLQRLDCNFNRQLDECDIARGRSNDCNANGVPDECESPADCNGNGLADICDLAAGTSLDCNENGRPDVCDVSLGASGDCDANGVPDECEDCNRNRRADVCDLADGTSQDCDANGVPDACELADRTGRDVNQNGILDPCEPGDVDGDGDVDLGDFLFVVFCFRGPGVSYTRGLVRRPTCSLADLDFDDDVDASDVVAFQSYFTGAR